MEIKFFSLNVENEWVKWSFSDANELSDILYSDDPDVPSWDDPVKFIKIGNVSLQLETIIENPDFLDLCAILGIISKAEYKKFR